MAEISENMENIQQKNFIIQNRPLMEFVGYQINPPALYSFPEECGGFDFFTEEVLDELKDSDDCAAIGFTANYYFRNNGTLQDNISFGFPDFTQFNTEDSEAPDLLFDEFTGYLKPAVKKDDMIVISASYVCEKASDTDDEETEQYIESIKNKTYYAILNLMFTNYFVNEEFELDGSVIMDGEYHSAEDFQKLRCRYSVCPKDSECHKKED